MIKIGTLFAGRYGIISKIGSGGMADVYKAQDVEEDRLVALKVLKDALSKDPMSVRRFEAEGEQASKLKNQNVVNVYGVGSFNGHYYISMEYVSGITLKEYIARKGALSARETLAISAQAACGLRAAHAHQFVHRDVKPQNIILSKDGRVKITDFGIASSVSGGQKSGKFAIGSVYYIAPEQAKGASCDERSDIYSLGIVMYEMITGRVPFDKDTAVGVALAHMNESMTPPSALNPECPLALEQIIFRCTQKSAERRYHNCTELIQDLKIAVNSPDYDFEKKEKATLLKNSTMVFHKPGIRDAEEEDERPANTRKKQDEIFTSTRKEAPSVIDRVFTIAGATLGAIALILLVYIIMSFSGCLSRQSGSGSGRTAPETTEEDVTLATKDPNDFDPELDTVVPNLIGLSLKDAIDALTEAELSYKLSSVIEYSDDYPLGTILKQRYPEGTVVEKGSVIYIQLSAGSDKFFIRPEYVGGRVQDFRNDIAKLTDVISVEYVRVTSETVPANIIISIDPVNVTVTQGAKIKVVFSAGPPLVKMPDLFGLTEGEARNKLENAGLLLGTVYTEFSDEYPKETIFKQQYAEGRSLQNGTTVDVTVSLGPDKILIPEDILGTDAEPHSYSEVYARLEELGASVIVATEYREDLPNETVLGIDPMPGSPLPENRKVTLTVSTNEKKLPNLVGLTLTEARVKYSADPYRFIFDLTYIHVDDDSENDRITSQLPAYSDNAFWTEGMTIRLTVKTTGYYMPDLIGWNKEEAKAELIKLGFLEGSIEFVADPFPPSDGIPNTISVMRPEAGKSVDIMSAVTLYYVPEKPEETTGVEETTAPSSEEETTLESSEEETTEASGPSEETTAFSGENGPSGI